jgi:hypothetical protein
MQCVIWQQKMYSYRREKIGIAVSGSTKHQRFGWLSLTHNNKLIIIVIVIQMSGAGEGFSCVVCAQRSRSQCACLQTHTYKYLCAAAAGQLEFPLFTFSAIRLMSALLRERAMQELITERLSLAVCSQSV